MRETRLKLTQLGWAVLLIDAIALGLGFLAGQYVPGAQWLGVILAAWVTVTFVALVGGNLAVWWLVRRATDWHRRRSTRTRR